MLVLAANASAATSIRALLFPHGNAFVVFTTLSMCFMSASDFVEASNDIL
jgi:hypothetical protein